MKNRIRTILQSLKKESVYLEIQNTEVLEKQRFVVFRIFTVIAILVCISVASKMLLTLSTINWLPFTILFLGLIILVNYLFIQKADQLRMAYVIMMISCFGLLHLVSYTCGGIRTGGTFFMSAVIIYSFMLLGNKGGWLMSIACGIHILFLFFISTYTNLTSFSLFQDRIDLINEDFLVNILLSFAMISALSSYLQSGRNVVIQRILNSQKELELINNQLRLNNLALEKKNAELDKFASVAAHDLRSPLRAIGSLTDMILEDDQSLCFDTHEKLKIIHGRVHRMDHLLSALLEYSRVDRKMNEMANVDLNVLLVGLLAKHSAYKKVKFTIQQNLPFIYTAPIKLEKVLDILIENAVKFNDKIEAEVSISVEQENKEWKISVKDNGPGIDPLFHDKIFIIFQTLEARDKIESSGAGLAIAKKLIEENGGKIEVDSNLGKGAIFSFHWKADIEYKTSVKSLVNDWARTA